MKNFKEALNCYINAFKINYYSTYYLNIGDCYYELGNYENALKFYSEYLFYYQDDEYVWFQKALVHEELQEYKHIALEC